MGSTFRILGIAAASAALMACTGLDPAMNDVSRRVDALRAEVNRLAEEQKGLAEEIRLLRTGERGPAPEAKAGPTAEARLEVQNLAADPAARYREAFTLFEAGKYPEAEAAFGAFVAAYPQSDLADNAQYWIGECLYSEKKFEEARKAFRAVSEHFPFGNKVPDALYKEALCQRALGDAAGAEKTLARLRELFPDSEAAAKAGASR
jgi:tol-pal system protein YbgF